MSDLFIGGGGGGSKPGGSDGDIQYNNNGALGGEALVPLAHGGTNADLSATGSATAVLAQAADHTISARALVAADIPALVTSKLTIPRNAQTGTTYAIQNSDLGTVITFADATATTIVAVTIAQAGAAGAFADGWWCVLKNLGSNYVKVTPTTSTLDTAAQMFMPPGASCMLFSDGTNYTLQAYGSAGYGVSGGHTFFITNGLALRHAAGNAAIAVANNDVTGTDIVLSTPQIIRRIVAQLQTGVSSQTAAFGLYDGNGNLLVTTGAVSAATSSATLNTTVTTTLLLPGVYSVAWTTTSTSVTCRSSALDATTNTGVFNQTVIHFWKATNAASAGDLPTASGTKLTATLADGNKPLIFFES